MTQLTIEMIDFGGLTAVFKALHLPYNFPPNSTTSFIVKDNFPSEKFPAEISIESHAKVTEHDYKLLEKLVKAGDEHSKVLRGLCVWLEITAPRYWWQEMSTYRVGVESLGSTSTMHGEARGLKGEELVELKESLPEGTPSTRILMFSYQTLRRIYKQRKNHRLPQWHTFCDFLKTLPLHNLITNE